MEMPDLTRQTLEGIITEWIQPGTRTISDRWASYYSLKQIHGGIYNHDVIVHECHFVHLDDDSAHTQNIEN